MSLGGSKSTSTSIDPALRDAALANLAMAKQVGQLGFVPYKGATVAGLSDAQRAAMGSTNLGAAAFGLPQAAVPAAGDMSPYAMYEAALASMAPGQRAFIEAMFIDPMTGLMRGAVPQAAMPAAAPAASPAPASDRREGRDRNEPRATPTRSGGTGSFGLPDPMGGRFAGTNLPGPTGSVVNRVTRSVTRR